MLFIVVSLFFLVLFLIIIFCLYRKKKNKLQEKKIALTEKLDKLRQEENKISSKINQFENKTSQLFTFYDTTRLISSLFGKEKLVTAFINKLNSLEDVEEASLSELNGVNCHKFPVGSEGENLYISTRSFNLLLLAPMFAKLLSVCFERIKLYARLQELSIHDYLTGIYNRRYFDQRLDEEFKRAKNLKHNLSFLMLDIDDFKKINDTYGHLVGDAVLKRCAALISESIREIDFAGRIGGEEFGMILLDTDKAGAIMVSERICSRISQEKIRVFDENIGVTGSVGVATYPSNTIYMDLLAEIADKALFRAKASGKDRVCWF